MYPMRSPKLPRIYPITPSSPMADFVDQWSANGLKNIFGTTREGRRDAVRGRRGRRGARLPRRRRSDHHLHRVSGPAADDPQHVQDRRRAAALRVPCFRAYRCYPRAEHLRRPFRRVWPAARPASPCCARATCRRSWTSAPSPISRRIDGQGPLHQLLRRLPHQPRDPEDRGLGL